MFYKNKYLLIPVDLCKYALVYKKVSDVRIYIFLKAISSGKIRIPNELIKSFSRELSITPKTFTKHLKLLIKANWIGYNPNSGYYFIRGFESIRIIESFKIRAACEFGIDDLKTFKEFCLSAFISYCINRQRSIRWHSKHVEAHSNVRRSKSWQSECLKARSNQDCQPDLLSYDKLALEMLAEFLGICKTSAHLYIGLGKDAGYLKTKEMYCKIKMKCSYVKQAREYNPRIKIRNGEVVLQLPNKITHNMHFKRRKKIEP